MPELFFDTLELIPEGLREHAKANDEGKIVVNVVPKVKLDEFRDTNIKIVKERDDLAKVAGKAKELLGTEDFEAAGATLTELRSVAQRVKDGQLVENKGLESAVEERTKQMREGMQEEISKQATEAKGWREKFTQTDQRLRRTYVDRAVTDVVLDETLGVHPKALSDILGRAYTVFEVGDDGKLTAKNGEAVRYGADAATPMSPKEWVLSLRDEAPYFFKGSNGGGSGGGDGKQFQGFSAQEIAKMSSSEKLAIANGEFKRRA